MTRGRLFRVLRWVVPALAALVIVVLGVRLGFERRTDRLPVAVMPERYRALPLPSTLKPVEDGCEVMHRGTTRRYACRYLSFDNRETLLARLTPALEAQGWKSETPERFVREDWSVSVRYSPTSPGLADVSVVLARGLSSHD
ncbi:MAG TPA: hypothetical protein VFS42_05175 [Burkholderiaceae bacterium]|nr:hypothetical protein [Burkholderiaceae bacterium]